MRARSTHRTAREGSTLRVWIAQGHTAVSGARDGAPAGRVGKVQVQRSKVAAVPTWARVVPILSVARVIAKGRIEAAPFWSEARLVKAQVPLADQMRAVAHAAKHLKFAGEALSSETLREGAFARNKSSFNSVLAHLGQHGFIDRNCIGHRVPYHAVLQPQLYRVATGEEGRSRRCA